MRGHGVLFRHAQAFVPSTDLSAFAGDCPGCEVDSRPFMIPPGLLLQPMGGPGATGPATIMLMATGLVGLVPVLRRRRRD